MVQWIFAQRLAGHSVARIARALNEAAIPCPSAADPGRNRHRPGTGWTLGTVTTILQNPRYTGRQVWNRQRTDKDLADPADVSLGHKSVQRWNLPDGWVISARPAHEALITEADYIAAQDVSAARGPVPAAVPAAPERRRYLLAGLLACGTCGRRMESAWSNVFILSSPLLSPSPNQAGEPVNELRSEKEIQALNRLLSPLNLSHLVH